MPLKTRDTELTNCMKCMEADPHLVIKTAESYRQILSVTRRPQMGKELRPSVADDDDEPLFLSPQCLGMVSAF